MLVSAAKGNDFQSSMQTVVDFYGDDFKANDLKVQLENMMCYDE